MARLGGGFPSVEEAVQALQDILDGAQLATTLKPGDPGYTEDDEDLQEVENGIEVRLQVEDNGAWQIHTGDPKFDTDHSGYWGYGWLTWDDGLEDLAGQLLEEAQDQWATSAEIDEEDEQLLEDAAEDAFDPELGGEA